MIAQSSVSRAAFFGEVNRIRNQYQNPIVKVMHAMVSSLTQSEVDTKSPRQRRHQQWPARRADADELPVERVARPARPASDTAM